MVAATEQETPQDVVERNATLQRRRTAVVENLAHIDQQIGAVLATRSLLVEATADGENTSTELAQVRAQLSDLEALRKDEADTLQAVEARITEAQNDYYSALDRENKLEVERLRGIGEAQKAELLASIRQMEEKWWAAALTSDEISRRDNTAGLNLVNTLAFDAPLWRLIPQGWRLRD